VTLYDFYEKQEIVPMQAQTVIVLQKTILMRDVGGCIVRFSISKRPEISEGIYTPNEYVVGRA
jgi:hypothetical protein